MTEEVKKFYKITTPKGGPYNGGSGSWDLPKRGNPGAWRSVKGRIIPCYRGFHVCTLEQLQSWYVSYKASRIWEVEVRGNEVKDGTKSVFRSARLIKDVTKEVRPYIIALKEYRTHYSSADYKATIYNEKIKQLKEEIKYNQNDLKDAQRRFKEANQLVKKANGKQKILNKLRKNIK